MPSDAVIRFQPFEARMQQEALPPLAIETFRHYYGLLASGATGLLAEPDVGPVAGLPDQADAIGCMETGRAALAKTVVIKLNGGLGTSMGLTRAKSLLPAKQDRSFLDLTVEQILHLRVKHGVQLPLLLMNSFRTRADSLDGLARVAALGGELPADFLQHKVPKIRADDLSPADWPADRAHEWCPPGHGDLYTALVTSGLLDLLLARGFEHAFVSNSDNLGAVIDPGLLGYFVERGLPFLMEVCDRTEADKKGGHLGRRPNGDLVLREVAQCPPEEIALFQDVARYRYFNTNTLWVSLPALRRVFDERDGVLGLPLIVNEKPVDPTDETSPRVFQLETAMGAAISVFEGAQAIRVSRERFIPVKTTNDLLVLWSDLYSLGPDRQLAPAPGRHVGDIVVDLDPRYYRRIDQLELRFPQGAPSLRECTRFTVRGDVVFGAGCVCRGDVTIRHEGPLPLRVPDHEVLR